MDDIINKYNTSNPFEICQLMGYELAFKSIGFLNGMYRYSRKNVFITINKDRDRYTQHATCGHELAHSIMHPNQNTVFMGSSTFFVTEKQEIEADRFSAYLQLEYYKDVSIISDRYLRLIDQDILKKYT